MNEVIRNEIKEKIQEIFQPYYGLSTDCIKQKFQIKSSAKSINSIIISKIFDLPSLDLEVVKYMKDYFSFKTVCINDKNRVTESMSFPAINYYDMIKNDWENSITYKYFSSRLITIFTFRKNEDSTIFENVCFLELNSEELVHIGNVWRKVKDLIVSDSLVIGGKNNTSVENFPKKDENPIIHVRPHDNNTREGKVLLPNGSRIINYCFWLNNNFIEEKIKEKQL